MFASGLRNPNGLGWQPKSGALWTVVNERDELGSDLVPDYLTSVKDGGFYGWPYSYFGQHVDTRVQPPRPDLVAKAIVPDYALGAHVAPLGLAFYEARLMPQYSRRRLRRPARLVEPHAAAATRWSSCRSPTAGRPASPKMSSSGFLDEQGNALGRPVGVAVDRAGALLVADDVGNAIWRVTPRTR